MYHMYHTITLSKFHIEYYFTAKITCTLLLFSMLLFCKSTRIWALSSAFSITHSFIIQLRYGAAIQHATLCALTCTRISSTASAVHIQHYTTALHVFYSTCYHNVNSPALGRSYITVLLFCT